MPRPAIYIYIYNHNHSIVNNLRADIQFQHQSRPWCPQMKRKGAPANKLALQRSPVCTTQLERACSTVRHAAAVSYSFWPLATADFCGGRCICSEASGEAALERTTSAVQKEIAPRKST